MAATKKQPAKKPGSVWVKCSECGDDRKKHRVLYRHRVDISEFEGGWSHANLSELVQCLGCESVRLRTYTEQPDPDQDYHDVGVFSERVYPDDGVSAKKRKASIARLVENEDELIPSDVHKVYLETLNAFDAKIRTLAGVGLRATVEAICVDLGMKQGTLDKKIKALVRKRLLTPPQGDLLHEERYLGNEAAHQMATPRLQELEDGLEIIEGLLNTIYLLPKKAERLKEGRLKKKAAKAVPPQAATKPS